MSYFLFIIRHILDIPISVLLNFKVFPFEIACRMPVLISHKVKLGRMTRDCIQIDAVHIKPFMIKIGIEGVEGVSAYRRSLLLLENGARMIFKGKASLSRGITVRATKGSIVFGENFYANCNLTVVCLQGIHFGADNLLGWDVSVRDCDGHVIYENGKRTNAPRSVTVGDHVWIGAHADLLKGAAVPAGSVVAYRSCVTKGFEERGILIGGCPAKKIKGDIRWER